MSIWYGKLDDAERYPDLEYWQAQTDAAKFAAAWKWFWKLTH